MPNSLDPDLDPNHSPAAPGGTRRINQIPLVIAALLVVLFCVIIFYVMLQKSKQKQPQVTKETLSAGAEAEKFIPKSPGWSKVQADVLPVALPAPSLPPLTTDPLPQLVPAPQVPQAVPPAQAAPVKDLTRINAISAALGAKIALPGFEAENAANQAGPRNPPAPEEETQMQKLAMLRSLLQGQQPGVMAIPGAIPAAEKPRDMSGLLPFDASNPQRWKSTATVENPTRFTLRAGTVIPGVLLSGVNSELPGTILAQASQNVYDSSAGRYLLIPQGSKLIGAYTSETAYGKDRLFVAWQRIVYPDGRALDIGAQPGTDAGGYAGFADKVNHHYVRLFGSAILMSAVVGGVSYAQQVGQNSNTVNSDGVTFNNTNTLTGSLSQSLGTVFGNVIAKMIEKNLDISPTIKIRPGYRFNILVIKDFELVPYAPYSYR
jgi:type IV secretion system protein VirB10